MRGLAASLAPLLISVFVASSAIAQATFTGLGDLAGGDFFSNAHGVSADGSIIAGSSLVDFGGVREAYRWDATNGMQGLGDPPGGSFSSVAIGISADGSTIVGELHPTQTTLEGFRRDAINGMQGDLA